MPELEVEQQYRTTGLLRTRSEIHRLYTETPLDLDAECAAALTLTGREPLLDVGCGPGVFLRHLRAHGHAGRLAGVDQSAAMIAEARRAAAEAGAGIEWFQGLADALPFADGEFAVLSARHMLYHVPDIPAALHEFARVVGPGGLVFAATNGARNLPGVFDLVDALVRHFGLNCGEGDTEADMSRTFNADNAPDLLGSVFPVVEQTVLPGALVFTEPEPIVDYAMTSSLPQRAAADPELSARIRAWATDEARRRIAASGGVWRDPKTVVLYRCVVGTPD